MTNIKSIVADYLGSLKGDSSRRSFAHISKALSEHVGSIGLEAAVLKMIQLGPKGAQQVIESWRDRELTQLATGTVAQRCGLVSALFQKLRVREAIEWTLLPFAPRVVNSNHQRVPTREEVEKLFAYIDSMAAAGDEQCIRDAALLRLIYCSCLKRTAATRLRAEDIDVRMRNVRVAHRCNQPRTSVPTTVQTMRALEAWMAKRGDAPGWVFFRTDRPDSSKALSGESVRRALESYSECALLPFLIKPGALEVAGKQHSEDRVKQFRLEAIDL